MQKPTDLYLVSSTLHFFWAWLLAFKNKPHRNAYLWLIDQYSDKPMAFVPFIDQVESPFVEWKLFDGREKGGIEKLKLRRKLFSQVKTWAEKNLVDRVFIGNDRSVFGQYIIKTLKQNSQKNRQRCTACFLDDGVFTYLGRAASQSWSEKYLDALAKKLMFGFWYDPPATVGASKWIDEVWVMFPGLVSDGLSEKKIKAFDLESVDLEFFKNMANKVYKKFYGSRVIKSQICLIALPNHKLFSSIEKYGLNLKKFIRSQKNVAPVYVKYHPSSNNQDVFGLSQEVSVILPSNISFEVLLVMYRDAFFIGDISTTTLVAQYFKRSGKTYMLSNTQAKKALDMEVLARKVGVEVISLGASK